MKPFDNFKLIEKFRKHFKNDDFEMTFVNAEYGTITCNHKRLMSAAFFYKEYVREYGWAFCDKEAEKSPVITPEFLKLCHFYEWNERNEFELYLISKDAEERFDDLKSYIPMFNEKEMEDFIIGQKKSPSLVNDSVLLYGWMVDNFHWDDASVCSLERCVIHNLRSIKRTTNFISDIRKITNEILEIKPQEIEKKETETTDVHLDSRGEKVVSLVKLGQSLFITGKAGTGKTTLLKEILRQTDKKVAVLAPTGVAAKNAIGITIHSFLRLPVTPYFPDIKNPNLYQLKRQDEQVVKNIEIIIIDEVSMVRCDLLDAMDDVLRHYRHNDKPFGGVQVIMFGDLFQLMPVAPDEDWEKLKKYYASPYFFSSTVYQKLQCKMLELKKVYRQNETDFITILNNIRVGTASFQEIKLLNTRYDNSGKSSHSDAIMLTTHNRRAKGYNWGKLQNLPGEIKEFKAFVSGWFPSDEYPTSYTLQLKVGAKVMFVKNDTIDHAFYNGMMGKVTKLGEGVVEVESEGRILKVLPQYWEHEKYIINKETKKLEVEVTGSFVQLPLMLAWAVTIHKSQGLTFDKVLIDAEKAFTFGQVYVALSRCRTLKGITLTTPLSEKCIKTDEVVKKFMAETQRVFIDEDEEDVQRKHLNFKNSEERTLFYIKNGLGIDDIIEQCSETRAIVLSHIAKLVAKGEVDAKDYVSIENYDSIVSLFHKYSIQADRKIIRRFAPEVSFGEIEIVRAQLAKTTPYRSETQVTNSKLTGKNHDKEVQLVLEISPKTFSKIKNRKKTSYKKGIYKHEDAMMFFVDSNIKLTNVSGSCPYALRKHDVVKFVSYESQNSIVKTVKSIIVDSSEISPDNVRWVATIEFK